ncbi:MAG: sigma-54-dependent Fis family transcriptional regulator [Gemmatimonadetes bacterium]|nr:sigma-54-dependent Fis family transcriptional regulator [Gemmatimonadota bacterium]
MAGRILVVDDDHEHRHIVEEKLSYIGYEVTGAASAEEALSQLQAVKPSVIVSDLRMPGMSGIDLLRKVKESASEIDVVMVTGHEDMTSVVDAMKAGAFDYVTKPVELGRLADIVRRCLEEQELNRAAERSAAAEADEEVSREAVVGRDPRMIEIYKMIGVLARNRTTVLVRGETGTGKEMVARAIHLNSAHAGDPFIAVNCTALTDSLLESELFGHVKGAFTGATSSRKGYFEMAGAGTVFLDEIGDTRPEFQTKLLRVLQDRQFFPVGGESPRTTDARVIAATHQPVEELVASGRFREDLYFRLQVVEIRVPPLRERRGDVPVLAQHLLGKIRQEMHGEARFISNAAMKRLVDYDWPGNVRELENVLTRAAILARGATIGPEHLSMGVSQPPAEPDSERDSDREPAGPPDLTVGAVIADHVQKVLEQTGGNKSESARLLGISRSRLARIIDKHDLEP